MNQIFFSLLGLVEFASIFGDDIGKEMSKLIVVASGRLVSGSISIGKKHALKNMTSVL